MEHPNENLAYSARFGLKHATDNTEKASKIAAAKYRSIMKRQLRSHEIAEIQNLINEIQLWQSGQDTPRSVVGLR